MCRSALILLRNVMLGAVFVLFIMLIFFSMEMLFRLYFRLQKEIFRSFNEPIELSM